MDIEEELHQTKKRLEELEAENERTRAAQGGKSSNKGVKVPTNILKTAFKLNGNILEHALEVEWAVLPNDEKKRLMKTTTDEMEAHGYPMVEKKRMLESLRRYYNSRRRTLTIKKSHRKRRLARRMSKLGVLNHRLRNKHVQKAVAHGTLRAEDETGVKDLRNQHR